MEPSEFDQLKELIEKQNERSHNYFLKLEKRIEEIESRLDLSVESDAKDFVDLTQIKDEVKERQFLEPLNEPIEVNISEPAIEEPEHLVAMAENSEGVDVKKIKKLPPKNERAKKVVPRAPSKVELALKALMENVLGPFSVLKEMGMKTFLHYKRQNRLPVFFMTLMGILTMLIGVGFLMQYSFIHLFGPGLRVFSGFVISLSLMKLGHFLKNKQGEEWQEFGSSFIGLSIVLNYLCVYFLSSFYLMISPTAGLALITANSILSFFLCIKNEFKVMSVITLVGGTFAPLSLPSDGNGPVFYFIYLFLLYSSNLVVSWKLKWPTLTMVAFAGFATVFSLLGNYLESGSSILVLHAFSYLFACSAFIEFKRLKDLVSKDQIVLYVTSLTFFVYQIFESDLNSNTKGIIFLVNGLLALAPSIYFFKVKMSKSFSLWALYSATLIGFSIPILTTPDVTALLWTWEALLLIGLGAKFKITSLRLEGLAVFVSVIGHQLLKVKLFMVYWNESLLHTGSYNFLSLGLFLYGAVFLYKRYPSVILPFESKLRVIFDEFFSLWLSICFYAPIACFYGTWAFVFLPVGYFFHTYRGAKMALPMTHRLGVLHFIALIGSIAFSVSMTGSLSFSKQPIWGRFCFIEGYLVLWGSLTYYRRVLPKHYFFASAYLMRKVAYAILPLTFLPWFFRHQVEWFPVSIFGSCLMTCLLLYRFRESYLSYELKILALLAIAVNGFDVLVYGKIFGNGIVGLWVGLILCLILVIQQKGFVIKEICNEYFRLYINGLFYYFGFVLYLSMHYLKLDDSMQLLSVAIYFLVLSYYYASILPIRSSVKLSFGIGLLLLILGTLSLTRNIALPSSLMSILALGVLGLNIFKNPIIYKGIKKNKFKYSWAVNQNVIQLVLLVNIFVIVALFTNEWTHTIGTFLIATQATLLLFVIHQEKFNCLKKLMLGLFLIGFLKLFLVDLSNTTMPIKVGVFISIGALMLGAAYVYQKKFHIAET